MLRVLTLVKLTGSSESEWKAGARRPGFFFASGRNQVTLLWLLAYSSVEYSVWVTVSQNVFCRTLAF